MRSVEKVYHQIMKFQDEGFPAISFFSGAMGLDLGLHISGFRFKVFVEIDKTCQETIRKNLPKIDNEDRPILGDITKLTAEEIMSKAGLSEVTLIAGGPPCQAFSTAGKRGSLGDPRGVLVKKYLELIGEIRPRFFVFENVPGILSAAVKHRPLDKRGKDHPPLSPEEELGSLLRLVILPEFERIGYEVIYGLVDAADYGVPQNRRRVIFIGSRDHEFSRLGIRELKEIMPPTHSEKGEGGLKKWKTLGDALRDLVEEDPEYIPYSESRAEVFAKIPPGKNWRYLRDTYGEEYAKKVMGGAYKASGGRVGFWRRLSFDRPCPTLPASPIQKSTGLCHPLYVRPLSVREYARIQDFPDWWEFAGTTSQKYRQIGNAVPVGLAKAIGDGIVRVMEMVERVGRHDITQEKVAYKG